jgi:hypothetical protein
LTNGKRLPYGNIPYPGGEEGLSEQIDEEKNDDVLREKLTINE